MTVQSGEKEIQGHLQCLQIPEGRVKRWIKLLSVVPGQEAMVNAGGSF